MKVRNATKPLASWLFGISVTVLFLALWGRAVVVDTDSLSESVAPLAESSTVVDLIADWAGEEFVDAGADPALVQPTIEYALESTALGQTVDSLLSQVVEAAASAHPGGSTVDMQSLLMPVVPEVSAALSEVGLDYSTAEIASIVEDLDPLVIREPGTSAIVGASSPTASRLGTATLLASLAIAVFGYWVMAVSEDRIAAFRGLLTRVAVGGLTFAILLRVGSWVLDPAGGRAPIPETLANLADSKWMIPLQVALVAGVIAGSIYVVRRWLRRGEVSPEPDVSPTQQQEQPLSLSGLR